MTTATRTQTITISIPGTPCFSFSPNTRTHWRVRAKEARDIKTATIYECRDAGSPTIHGPVVLDWVIAAAKRRQPMDVTNAIACLKAHEDGLVTAGVIDGDTPNIVKRINVTQYRWADHKIDAGYVMVTIRAWEDG